jgi:hypothetical protein
MVLIMIEQHTWVMVGFVLIMLLLLAGPLALVAGVDSRIDDASSRHRPGIR